MAVLTPAVINRGVYSTADLTGNGVDPGSELTAASSGGDTFQNGTDRRTFIYAVNGDATDRLVQFYAGDSANPTFFYDTASGRPLWWRTQGATGANTHQGGRLTGGILPAGESRLYGPFNPYFVNGSDDTVRVVFKDNTSPYAVNVTSITVAAFYLPWSDAFQSTTGTAPSETAAPTATPDVLSRQTLTPQGLDVSFTDHDTNAEGFVVPLNGDGGTAGGTRRFVWVRNNSGSDDVDLIWNFLVKHEFPISSQPQGSHTWEIGWGSHVLDDGEEFLLGPWDHRLWAQRSGTYLGYIWTYCLSSGTPTFTPGTTSGFDFAPIELAP